MATISNIFTLSNMKKLTHFRILFLLITLFLISCNNLPSDLKIKRDECNNFSDKLLEKEKTAKSETDYQLLTEDYKLLKEMIINYTQECNNRGIKKNNDNLIKDIEEKILRFERQSGNSLSNL